jgi:hypothetical protein
MNDKDKKQHKKDESTDVHPLPYDSDQVLHLPQMSYTAIMSSREMAGSFLRYLLSAASKMVPRQWTAQDLQDILTFVIEGGESPVQFIEGRYLRRRIQEQIVRAERYREPFAIMVLKSETQFNGESYAGLVDLLTERLRRSDMVFLYKQKVAIVLPHTPGNVLERLIDRINKLAQATDALKGAKLSFSTAYYPSDAFATPYEILDWIEDELR